MCNQNETNTPTSVYEEDTEIESDKNRDIYKKKDQPYRKQFCTYDNCNAYFFVKWHLERHLRTHTGERPFICDHENCCKSFTCRSYLNKHIKQVHETEKKPVRVRKTYPCLECGHVFKQKYNLKAHMYLHTGEKPFNCDQCDKSFTNASRLRKHSKLHKGYKCYRENCDFVASVWTELQKHIAQDHREVFNCEVCNKKFNERYALTSHMKIHSGVVPSVA